MSVKEPFPHASFPVMTAKETYGFVLEHAGATLPKRDPIDTRVVGDVKNGKPVKLLSNVKLPEKDFEHRRLPKDSYKIGIITDISQVGGYPVYKGTPYKDSDNDGIPDTVEKEMGLNPNDPSDSAKITASGYANIEIYLNKLAAK